MAMSGTCVLVMHRASTAARSAPFATNRPSQAAFDDVKENTRCSVSLPSVTAAFIDASRRRRSSLLLHRREPGASWSHGRSGVCLGAHGVVDTSVVG